MIMNLPFLGEVKKQITSNDLHASSMIQLFSISVIKIPYYFWGAKFTIQKMGLCLPG